jgi:hypothetical protein
MEQTRDTGLILNCCSIPRIERGLTLTHALALDCPLKPLRRPDPPIGPEPRHCPYRTPETNLILVLISILFHVASLPINHLLGVVVLCIVWCGSEIVTADAKDKNNSTARLSARLSGVINDVVVISIIISQPPSLNQ